MQPYYNFFFFGEKLSPSTFFGSLITNPTPVGRKTALLTRKMPENSFIFIFSFGEKSSPSTFYGSLMTNPAPVGRKEILIFFISRASKVRLSAPFLLPKDAFIARFQHFYQKSAEKTISHTVLLCGLKNQNNHYFIKLQTVEPWYGS